MDGMKLHQRPHSIHSEKSGLKVKYSPDSNKLLAVKGSKKGKDNISEEEHWAKISIDRK